MTTTELFSSSSYQAITTVYCLLFIAAFLLNGSVLVTFLSTSNLRNIANFLLLSMAIADFLMAVLADAVGAYANANKWPELGRGTCVYYGFITTALGLTSMMHLTALTVERWIKVTLPMMKQLTEKQILGVIAFLWFFAFLWAFFPLVGWSSFGPEPGYAACSIAWYTSDFNNKSYIICLFVFFFFLPIIIMIACFSHIYVNVRRLSKDAVSRWGTDSLATQETFEAERKTVRMSFVMVLAYLIAWTPYAAVSLYASFGDATTVSILLSTLPAMLAKTSACYNPIIYFFMYRRFRRAAKGLLMKNIIKPSNNGASSSSYRGSSVIPTSFPRLSLFNRSSKADVSRTTGTVIQVSPECLDENQKAAQISTKAGQ